MRTLALVLSLIGLSSAQGQLLDSIALFTAQPAQFVAKLDIRGSFIRNQNVRIMGAKVGFEHAFACAWAT